MKEKKVFTRNEKTVARTAFLNWRTDKYDAIGNMIVLADGFLTASIELAEQCLIDNLYKKADILIFPILNNANHGIELYLKVWILILNEINDSDQKVEEKHHNIFKLFELIRSKMKKQYGDDWLTGFDKANRNLKDYLDELASLIKPTKKKDNMDFSRYPFKINDENHFYVDEIDNVEVDLENFVKRFQEIKSVLNERVSYFFYQELRQEW